MKKKIIIILSLTGFLLSPLMAEVPSELELYNELNIYSNAKYYPGVIEEAEKLEKNYPQSVFIVTARIAKGQALTILNRYEEAEETFASVLSSLRFGAEDYAKCWYYLGLAYYQDGDYTNAISAFHTCCDVEQRENKLEFYPLSILYSARINFFMELYEKSIPLFEYVITNGNYFSKAEYDEALQKLLFAYNNTERYEDTISLYKKFQPADFSDKVYSALTIYTADAYEKRGDVQAAYTTLNKFQNDDFKEMLSVFRLNLGVAAYNKKDYKAALEYFTLAQDSSEEANLITAFIYKQKIELDQKGKASAIDVKTALLDNQEGILSSSIQGLSDSYYSLLMRCYAFTDEASSAIECYEKIEKPGPKDALVAATILSRRNKLQAENLIAPFIADSDCAKLYARLLSANQKYEKAEAVYGQLEKNNKMDGDSYIEYAKVLYRLEKWEEALSVLKGQTKHPLYSYLTGLCRYNLKYYITAYAYLDNYTTSKDSEPGYKKIAHFYKSLCEYKEGRYENAYTDFSAYVNTYTAQDEYLYRAYELGAKSALMQSDLKNAIFMARGMISSSQSVSQKQDAVIYCSEILTDSKDYDDAIKLLAEYTSEKSDFSVRCINATARIYEKQGLVEKADSYYQQIIRDYADSTYSEDAAYRSGEIFYSVQNYSEAEARFIKYIYNYINGKYCDAAYYFSGDCNMKNGQLDKAIMQNTMLLSKYPDSIYSYGAYKNLLQAYYAQENYRDALSTARLLVRNYSEQAKADGIGSKVVELERIVSGGDRTIVEKEGEYDRAGKALTKKGRNAGSELVYLYARHEENEKAFNLAIELLQYQKDSDEMYNAAENAAFVAEYYYNKGQSQNAAEYYLKAAQYYRSSPDDESEKAAAALYSAVDSFVAAGLNGDARVTAELLVDLYPQTKQGQKVMNLIK